MEKKNQRLFWIVWVVVSVMLAAYFLQKIYFAEDKSGLLIGEATHGHHQIELSCDSCHTDAFGAGEVLQNACVNCHQEELDNIDDSHPIKKFNDPRNADLLSVINAKQCVSCHTEHQNEQTHPMGVTLPEDVCFHCHQEVGENRESHKGLGFETCASAGCHNYHDNKALYEDFLVKHAGGNWLNPIAQVNTANNASLRAKRGTSIENVSATVKSLEKEKVAAHPDVHQQWLSSAHQTADVTCMSCHVDSNGQSAGTSTWVEKPGIEACQTCHQTEVKGFTEGKHGMRLSEKLAKPLSPMKPSLVPERSHLSFTEVSAHQELSCSSCHSAHEYNTQPAQVESCLACHADEHSQAYLTSPHASLWEKAKNSELDKAAAVTCATCHLPKVKVGKENGVDVFRVEHNQNMNLRPNEKMIRSVCLDCHNLEFSIDSLADKELIKNNFNGKPKQHIESIDWALKRQ